MVFLTSPTCKLTAIVSHCQPTFPHGIFPTFIFQPPGLWFPNSVFSVLAHFPENGFSGRGQGKAHNIRAILTEQEWVPGFQCWLHSLPSAPVPPTVVLRPFPRLPTLHRECFQNHWNNIIFWQILPHIYSDSSFFFFYKYWRLSEKGFFHESLSV